MSHPTANEVGGKRGHTVEPIPSPELRELLDGLCRDTGVAAADRPGCPGHRDSAGGTARVSKANRLPSSGAVSEPARPGTRRRPGDEWRPCPLRSLGKRRGTNPGEAGTEPEF